jgi:hypothetical protein
VRLIALAAMMINVDDQQIAPRIVLGTIRRFSVNGMHADISSAQLNQAM